MIVIHLPGRMIGVSGLCVRRDLPVYSTSCISALALVVIDRMRLIYELCISLALARASQWRIPILVYFHAKVSRDNL